MVNHGNMYGPAFTFLGIPACDLDDPKTYQGADVIIVGAPIDSGTSHRSGAKFGPQAIRGGDYLPHDGERPHLALRTDGLKDLKVLDAGDLLMPGGDLVAALAVLREATEKISRAGAIAVVLGGDHSIASADVAGIANHLGHGKVSMIHFDAHADTGEDQGVLQQPSRTIEWADRKQQPEYGEGAVQHGELLASCHGNCQCSALRGSERTAATAYGKTPTVCPWRSYRTILRSCPDRAYF